MHQENKMFIPKVPKNSLKNVLEDLAKVCKALDNDEDNNWTNYLYPPADLEKIAKWESDNKTQLPQSYKDFLAFSDGATVRTNLLYICPIDDIEIVNTDSVGEIFRIGSLIGDGEVLYFLQNGEMKRGFLDKYDKVINSLGEIITQTIEMLSDDIPQELKDKLHIFKTKEHKVQAASIKAADAFLMKLYMAQLAKEKEAARGE
jgi:hypothetical protein